MGIPIAGMVFLNTLILQPPGFRQILGGSVPAVILMAFYPPFFLLPNAPGATGDENGFVAMRQEMNRMRRQIEYRRAELEEGFDQ